MISKKLSLMLGKGLGIDFKRIPINVFHDGMNKILRGGDLDDIKTLVKQKGKNFWYNSSGKLLINSGSDKGSLNEVLKIVASDPKKYLEKNLIHVNIIIWEDNESVPAPINLNITILQVNEVMGKIALNLRDNSNSLIRIYLEPDQFDLNDIKKLGKIVLDKKLKDGIEYSFKDVSKFIKK